MCEINFETEVKKIGGSLGIIIPYYFVRTFNLRKGQAVNIKIQENNAKP